MVRRDQALAQWDTIARFKAYLAVKGLSGYVFAFDLKFQRFQGKFSASRFHEAESLTSQAEPPVAFRYVEVRDGSLATAKLDVVAESKDHVAHIFAAEANQPYTADGGIPQQEFKTSLDFGSSEPDTIKFIVFPDEIENCFEVGGRCLNEFRLVLYFHRGLSGEALGAPGLSAWRLVCFAPMWSASSAPVKLFV